MNPFLREIKIIIRIPASPNDIPKAAAVSGGALRSLSRSAVKITNKKIVYRRSFHIGRGKAADFFTPEDIPSQAPK